MALVYWRRRVLALVLIVGLALGLGLLVSSFLDGAGAGSLTGPEPSGAGAPAHSYVVQPGDTLWRIATRLRPDGDPRPVVDALTRAHGSATLQVGERLELP